VNSRAPEGKRHPHRALGGRERRSSSRRRAGRVGSCVAPGLLQEPARVTAEHERGSWFTADPRSGAPSRGVFGSIASIRRRKSLPLRYGRARHRCAGQRHLRCRVLQGLHPREPRLLTEDLEEPGSLGEPGSGTIASAKHRGRGASGPCQRPRCTFLIAPAVSPLQSRRSRDTPSRRY
jgi:hypothetical protein